MITTCCNLYLFCTDANATRNSSFGAGSGPIWADGVACMGQEDRIVDCSTNLVSSSCSHTTDAGVECSEACVFVWSIHSTVFTVKA